MLCLSGLERYSRWVPLRVNRTELCMEPVRLFPVIYLTYCMEYVKIFIMNRYISNSYTTSKNTIDRQYTERGQL